MSLPLQNRTIAIPETRELDLFAQMLEQRGATTIRCPLVAILDAPDPAPVLAWLKQLISGEFDEVILFTGEGLRRLIAAAERAHLKEQVIAALAQTRKITRGPKPARALRDLGLRSDLAAEEATTDGIMALLDSLELHGHQIGVQLYGTEPNHKLIKHIHHAGATAFPVAPYIYASKADDNKVSALINQLALGEIDVIAFTSAQQVTRLFEVGQNTGLEAELKRGLERTKIAAVGPVVADYLQELGIKVDMMPQESFFLKPLVNAIIAALNGSPTDAD